MRKIYLHGALGAKYGKSFELEVATAAEALRALNQLPGFIEDMRAGSWHIVRGDLETGMDLDLEDVASFRLGRADLHFVPAIAGAKDGGATLKTILGVAVVGTAFALSGGTLAAPILVGSLTTGMTWGNVAMIGLGLALSGAASIISPQSNTPVDHNSYTMNGPTNIYQQGGPVPLVYGFNVWTGGVLISGGLNIDRIAAQ